MKFVIVRSVVLSVAIVTLLSACDSNSVSISDEARVSLSIASSALDGTAAAKRSDHVTLSSVKILVREIQFHARDSDTEGDSLDFFTESVVISLDTDTTATEIAVASVPAGSYHKVSFRIHKPEEQETPPDPDFKIGQSGLERFSVIVTGEYDGAPFTYRSSKAMHQTITLDEDLVIDGTEVDPLNLTLFVDLDQWFVGKGGEDLDPTSENNSTTSHIDKSIRDSFRLFKDRDRNGRPDTD